MLKVRSLALASALFVAGAANAVPVFSESFGTDALPSLGQFNSIFPSVLALNPNIYAGLSCCGGSNAYAGGGAAVFDAGSNASTGIMSTSFATTIGGQYTVSFDFGVFGPSLQTIGAFVSETSAPTSPSTVFVQSRAGTTDLAALTGTYNFSFTASTASTTLSFLNRSTSTSNSDLIIDNVSVTAVPEPETIAMMLAGLGLLGFVGRRRSR